MKISTKGRYALRLMTDVAIHEGDGFVPLKEVAARQGISIKYLEQIAASLGRAEMLRSGRGAQGGYRLARAPETYTLGSILRLTEGNLAPVTCLEDPENDALPQTRTVEYDFYPGSEETPGAEEAGKPDRREFRLALGLAAGVSVVTLVALSYLARRKPR